MTLEIAMVFAILLIAIVLLITNWVRMDVVALLVLSSLAITGLVSPAEALSGFSNPAVITVWAILILSGGLARTGVASILGRKLLQLAGDSEVRLLVIIMLTVGVLSGFMNTIGVVSLFLPVVLDIARRTKQPPSKLLMPLAFAGILGGLNTLIGTPPNILISEALKEGGLQPFRMFDFTPVGISVLLAGTAYMAVIGRRLLPSHGLDSELSSARAKDYKSLYELQENMVMLHLPASSILHGKTLSECRLGSILGMNVVAVMRDGHTQLSPNPSFTLQSNDRLMVEGQLDQLSALHGKNNLVVEKEGFTVENLFSAEIEFLEVRLLPGSYMVGQNLMQVDFRHQYQGIVLAIRRGDIIFRTNFESIALLPDDILLVQGWREQLENLMNENDLTHSSLDSLEAYKLEERFMVVHVPNGSGLIGKTLIDSRLAESFGLGVLGIIRAGETRLIPTPNEILREGDTLLVKGKQNDLRLLEGMQDLLVGTQPIPELDELESDEIGLVESVLSPHSSLVGKTLQEINFRVKYGLSVLAIWRQGRAFRTNLRDMPLFFGDALLLHGPRERLRILGSEPDFLVLTEEAQEAPRQEKIPIALLVMGIVLVPVIFGWLPIAITAILGVTLMILTGCLDNGRSLSDNQLDGNFSNRGHATPGNCHGADRCLAIISKRHGRADWWVWTAGNRCWLFHTGGHGFAIHA